MQKKIALLGEQFETASTAATEKAGAGLGRLAVSCPHFIGGEFFEQFIDAHGVGSISFKLPTEETNRFKSVNDRNHV